MTTMYAAMVTSFYEPPHHVRVEVPPMNDGEELVRVLAVAVHPQVRLMAAGGCAEELGDPPLLPGIDAVGRRADGSLIYFLATSDVIGTMAERALARPNRSIDLPEDVDVAAVAAGMLSALVEGASFKDLPDRVARIRSAELVIPTRTMPLSEVEEAWMVPEDAEACLVIVPD